MIKAYCYLPLMPELNSALQSCNAAINSLIFILFGRFCHYFSILLWQEHLQQFDLTLYGAFLTWCTFEIYIAPKGHIIFQHTMPAIILPTNNFNGYIFLLYHYHILAMLSKICQEPLVYCWLLLNCPP
jgi:hypothetical protein